MNDGGPTGTIGGRTADPCADDAADDQPGPPAILVLGLGNVLLSDEGVGVKAVEVLQRRYHMPAAVEVVDGGTMGMELIPYFEKRRRVILIDAVRSGGAPGSVVKIEDPPAFLKKRMSPHHIGLGDVLAFVILSYGRLPAITLLGMEPDQVTPGLDLSPAVAHGFPRLVTRVVAELEALDVQLTRKIQ